MNVNSSTIAGNYAGHSGGICVAGGTTIVTNSILWDNIAGDGSSHQIYGSPTVSYSDIEGGFGGTGNVNDDPLFTTSAQASTGISTTAGVLTIQPGSGAIDVGGGADEYMP